MRCFAGRTAFVDWKSVLSLLCALLLASGCASLRPVPRVPSYAIAQSDQTTLGRVFAARSAERPGQSGFQVIPGAQSAFASRAALVDTAERTLDLQSYSVGDDLTSDLLLQRIVAAADRGVRIRILLDDVHPSTRVFARRAAAAGVDVRMFNPFVLGGARSVGRLVEFMFDPQRLNRRMHNKLWVTDNAVAIVGSRNLGDEYFGVHETANFNDVDLMVVGPIVQELSTAFDTYWNSELAVPLEALEQPDAGEGAWVRNALQARLQACGGSPPCTWLAQAGLVEALRSGSVALSWASARAIYDQPNVDKSIPPAQGSAHGADVHRPNGLPAQRELLIVSPYFVPDEEERRHLAKMVERGVRVAVLTNSLASTDSPAAHAAYARYRVDLLRSGIELYETRLEPGIGHRRSHRWGRASPSSLHAKLIVQDRARAVIGSFNQDPRSRLHNTEACVAVESAELAVDLAALFEEASESHHAFRLELSPDGRQVEWYGEADGETVRFVDEPLAGVWLRIWRKALGALIPEHQL